MAKLTEEEKLKIILFDEKFRSYFWSNVDKTGGENELFTKSQNLHQSLKAIQFDSVRCEPDDERK